MERYYQALRLEDGLAAFADTRRRNVDRLRSLRAKQWRRKGTQEGVGSVSLCDIPIFMAQHDEAHRREIDEWPRHGR